MPPPPAAPARARVVRVSPTVGDRHAALRSRLPAHLAGCPASPGWVRARVACHARTAGIACPQIAVDLDELEQILGAACPRPVDAVLLGWADWQHRPGAVLVAVDQLATAAEADLVAAHEVAHPRVRRAGHPARLFTTIQRLLDTAADQPTLPARRPRP